MIIFFLILFIVNEIFYLSNRSRLNLNYKNKDVSETKKIDIIHYLIKIISYVYPIIGLFSDFSDLFKILILIASLKFIFYHINNKLFLVYISLLPIILIISYLSIIYYIIN